MAHEEQEYNFTIHFEAPEILAFFASTFVTADYSCRLRRHFVLKIHFFRMFFAQQIHFSRQLLGGAVTLLDLVKNLKSKQIHDE